MKPIYIAILLISAFSVSACSNDVPAPAKPLDAAQLANAKTAQGPNKAQNNGGVMPDKDPPPPTGVKTGIPTVGTKG